MAVVCICWKNNKQTNENLTSGLFSQNHKTETSLPENMMALSRYRGCRKISKGESRMRNESGNSPNCWWWWWWWWQQWQWWPLSTNSVPGTVLCTLHDLVLLLYSFYSWKDLSLRCSMTYPRAQKRSVVGPGFISRQLPSRVSTLNHSTILYSLLMPIHHDKPDWNPKSWFTWFAAKRCKERLQLMLGKALTSVSQVL